MAYRTISIDWLPRCRRDWHIFTAARTEAANVWNWLVEEHAALRTACSPWPTKAEWQKAAKGRFCNLNAQSVQQTVADFCDAVKSITELRRNGHRDARYPFRKPRYRQVIFTNQIAKLRDGFLILPCGQAGKIKLKVPQSITVPGRLMEVRLHYETVQLVCKVPDEVYSPVSPIGVDLGVNTLLAATDGQEAILISGRKLKSLVRLRNKHLGEINHKQSKQTKGSRRWHKLQRRKYRTLNKHRRQVRDLCHKATCKVSEKFHHAKAYVGEPFNDAAQKIGKVAAQQVSQTCNAILINQLGYKLSSAIRVNEAYTSQECPCCGKRTKCRRIYHCECGLMAPRDVVGAVNIISIGQHGSLVPGRRVPNAVRFCHPESILALPGSPAGTGQVARPPGREAADF